MKFKQTASCVWCAANDFHPGLIKLLDLIRRPISNVYNERARVYGHNGAETLFVVVHPRLPLASTEWCGRFSSVRVRR